jgi:hypothetical protein
MMPAGEHERVPVNVEQMRRLEGQRSKYEPDVRSITEPSDYEPKG